VLIYSPATDRPLALRTVAVDAIPAARIKAGTLRRPVTGRRILHGLVTDRER
jgi:hypothetical protein